MGGANSFKENLKILKDLPLGSLVKMTGGYYEEGLSDGYLEFNTDDYGNYFNLSEMIIVCQHNIPAKVNSLGKSVNEVVFSGWEHRGQAGSPITIAVFALNSTDTGLNTHLTYAKLAGTLQSFNYSGPSAMNLSPTNICFGGWRSSISIPYPGADVSTTSKSNCYVVNRVITNSVIRRFRIYYQEYGATVPLPAGTYFQVLVFGVNHDLNSDKDV